MRRYLTISLICMLLVPIFSFVFVPKSPAYAQSTSESIPNINEKKIYFSEANNEISRFDRSDEGISRFAGLLRLGGANLFTLEWRKGIPVDADLIVIPGPSSDLSEDMVARLWAYLQNGGKVLVIPDTFDDRGNVSRALQETRGLFALTWSDLGVAAKDNVIVEEGELREISVTERNRDDEITFQFTGEVPELSVEFLSQRVNSRHPITSGLTELLSGGEDIESPNLNNLYFNGARSIEIDASLQNIQVTPLIFTDDILYGETDYRRYQENGYVEYNIGEDTQRGDLILAAAFEDPRVEARMVVIGDADMVRNGTGFSTSPSYSGSFVYPANAQFMMRTVAWLLGAEQGMLDLPTPAPTATPTITPTPTPLPPTATPGSE